MFHVPAESPACRSVRPLFWNGGLLHPLLSSLSGPNEVSCSCFRKATGKAGKSSINAELTMDNVQPILCGGNGVATDLQIVLSESSDSILVFLGVALLERIRCSPEALEYKMLVGRLVNAGKPLEELRRAFGHDPRTMKRWAAALNASVEAVRL